MHVIHALLSLRYVLITLSILRTQRNVFLLWYSSIMHKSAFISRRFQRKILFVSVYNSIKPYYICILIYIWNFSFFTLYNCFEICIWTSVAARFGGQTFLVHTCLLYSFIVSDWHISQYCTLCCSAICMYTYAIKLTSVIYRRRRQIAFTRLTLLFTQFNGTFQLRKLRLVSTFESVRLEKKGEVINMSRKQLCGAKMPADK